MSFMYIVCFANVNVAIFLFINMLFFLKKKKKLNTMRIHILCVLSPVF